MPGAAKLGDPHVCPLSDPAGPHGGGPLVPSPALVPTVFIEGSPAAKVGDIATCARLPNTIMKGSLTVNIQNMPAARMGDLTAHGGSLMMGSLTVNIGG